MADPEDIFGDIVDADTIEQAAKQTLQAWLPAHLAHQERRRDLQMRSIAHPRSWPTVSEFDPEPHEQLPSIVLVSPGTTGEIHRDGSGRHSATWRLDIIAAVASSTEPEVRRLAGVYAAAIRGVLVQNPELGGVAARTRWMGEDYAVGTTHRGPRAMVEVSFEIDVDDVVDARLGPLAPPPDPYDPGALPEIENATLTVERSPIAP
jgi:hypothetical protein